jgi:signal transduction histidine kinase
MGSIGLRLRLKDAADRWKDFRGATPVSAEVFLGRVRFLERNLGVPARLIALPVIFFLLFSTQSDTMLAGPRADLWYYIRNFTLIYSAVNVGTGIVLIWGMKEISTTILSRVVYGLAILDAAFVASLTLLSGGFDSILYWVLPGMIVRNAAVIPFAEVQILVNVLCSVFYIGAGAINISLEHIEMELTMSMNARSMQQESFGNELTTEPVESIILRVLLLLLLTIICYGLQVLWDRKRQREVDAHEFALKQDQLHAAGRLAAEIAHQLKNPLGIINNAAYTLQKTVKEGKTITQQIGIIREEVARSDRIITELMGYAQLAEGKVERLDAVEVAESAIHQAFPPGAGYNITVQRDFGPSLPMLLGQRGHFTEIVNNLLVNAREAMNGIGTVTLSIRTGADYSIVIGVRDNGPGIPPERLNQIWEPYYTTKSQGTGLGLAIVKHNAELYGGRVRVESELGKGASFMVTLPARTVMRLRP